MSNITFKPAKKERLRCTGCGKFLAGSTHRTYPICNYSCMIIVLTKASKTWPPRKEIVSLGTESITE